jgi:hypothetical protein
MLYLSPSLGKGVEEREHLVLSGIDRLGGPGDLGDGNGGGPLVERDQPPVGGVAVRGGVHLVEQVDRDPGGGNLVVDDGLQEPF